MPLPSLFSLGSADPAIGLLELSSIARALRVGDEMVKRAACRVLLAEPVSPGKFLILISGEVAVVDESFRAGVEAAGEHLLDRLFLPGVHPQILPAIEGTLPLVSVDSLGVVETGTVAAAVVAADAACKATSVHLLEMRLGAGIGGKGVFTLTGILSDVEASVEAAWGSIGEESLRIHREIIPRPHGDFQGRLR